jgi:hypothetical protein
MLYRLLFLQDDQQPAARRRPAFNSIPFESTCPKCRVRRSQRGSRGALERLLYHGHPIEAFCEVCDDYWTVSLRERGELAKDIAGQVTSP